MVERRRISWLLLVFLLLTMSGGQALAQADNGADAAADAPYRLWTGGPIPNVEAIDFVPGMRHSVLHRAVEGEYQFLHGAAIVAFKGLLFAHWANSRVDENSASETLRGRRSADGGQNWSEIEVIGPGYADARRHSHGVFLEHDERLWAFGASFGGGPKRRYFSALGMTAYSLDPATDRWVIRGRVADDFWPYDEPVPLPTGNWITGGQNGDGKPVVAISSSADFSRMWTVIQIPVPEGMKIAYGETSVIDGDKGLLAVVRPAHQNVALVSTSRDNGRTWTTLRKSNYPMVASKPFVGRLSTGQPYLLANMGRPRDTLVIAVGQPGALTFDRVWRIRHGDRKPRHPGRAKSGAWAYPYGHEHDGKLYVVYSVAKEDCGLTIIPVTSLAP